MEAIPGVRWNASNDIKLGAIIRVLAEAYPRPVRWKELRDTLKREGEIRSKITLKLYLKSLEESKLIRVIRKSRRQVYYTLSRKGIAKFPMLKLLVDQSKTIKAFSKKFARALKHASLPEERLRDYIYMFLSYTQLAMLSVLSWPSVAPMERSFIRKRLMPEYANSFADLIGCCWRLYPELASEAFAYLAYTFLSQYASFCKGEQIVPSPRIDLDTLCKEGLITKEQINGLAKLLEKKKFRKYRKYAFYLRAGLIFLSWMKQASTRWK